MGVAAWEVQHKQARHTGRTARCARQRDEEEERPDGAALAHSIDAAPRHRLWVATTNPQPQTSLALLVVGAWSEGSWIYWLGSVTGLVAASAGVVGRESPRE